MSPATAPLGEYQRKRNFSVTKEPAGSAGTKRSRALPVFVIQKHDASRLHFDLRLEVDGVMKSWAVPKGPSLDPSVKRLAMQVEDHPMEYNSFEGIIPKGEYGGGTVMIWDQGHYETGENSVHAMRKGLADGKIEFTLHGEKVRGAFALVRLATRRKGSGADGKEWLLIKQRDAFTSTKALSNDGDRSAASDRTMAQIAKSNDVWHSNRAQNGNVVKAAATAAAPRHDDAVQAATLTAALTPMLATSVDTLPAGEEWAFEPKYDGIRILAFVVDDEVRLVTGNGLDKGSQFPEIPAALRAFARRQRKALVLDGEIVGLGTGGMPGRFQSLQGRMHARDTRRIEASRQDAPAVMMLFDVLMAGPRVLIKQLWSTRRALLERLCARLDADAEHAGLLRLGDVAVGSSDALLKRAVRDRWEGLMAKRVHSPYAVGRRSREWIKYKLEHEQEFVVGGWTDPRNARAHFGALLLGYWQDGALQYAGRVGAGFAQETLHDIGARLRRLQRVRSPFEHPPTHGGEVHWVQPRLVAQVRFNEWTANGHLRQPVFLGLRTDKNASDVTRDLPSASGSPSSTSSPPPMTTISKSTSPTGVSNTRDARELVSALTRIEEAGGDGLVSVNQSQLRVSNLDKIYFPKLKRTKGDMLRYYAQVSPLLLPHLADRPLVLRRYPDGIDAPAFFQQRAPDDVPDGVRAESVTREGKEEPQETERRLVGGDLPTLLYCAQLGGIDMNPWHSRLGSLAFADYSILDLDPGPRAKFGRVVEIARLAMEMLDAYGLHGAIKTSGASGLHIFIPLPARTTYQSSLLLAQLIATEVATASPKEATVVRTVKARPPAAVYVDYLQNVQGKSVASVFSVRARAEASISMPIRASELTADLDPRDFTTQTSIAELRRRAQLWTRALGKPVDLSALGTA